MSLVGLSDGVTLSWSNFDVSLNVSDPPSILFVLYVNFIINCSMYFSRISSGSFCMYFLKFFFIFNFSVYFHAMLKVIEFCVSNLSFSYGCHIYLLYLTPTYIYSYIFSI